MRQQVQTLPQPRLLPASGPLNLLVPRPGTLFLQPGTQLVLHPPSKVTFAEEPSGAPGASAAPVHSLSLPCFIS